MTTKKNIDNCISTASDRYDFWINFINTFEVHQFAEIGVFRGDYAERILQSCASLEKYYMLDPWRNLEKWDKPANINDDLFNQLMQMSLEKTEFASNKRVILRGKTTEIIDNIPDDSLDCAYIDGDHTLKGITIDLIRVFPKIKTGGFLGGDDFCPGELQHFPEYEPTLVFPFAIYFAEAVSARIYTLPYDQFLIEKTDNGIFELIDLAGTATNTGVKEQILTTIRNSSDKIL